MSLVFLAADFPPSRGGIQTMVHELLLALTRAGQQVGVVAVCQPGAEEFDEGCPYPVVRVPAGSKGQVAANMAAGVDDLVEQLGSKVTALVATKWFPEGLAAVWSLRPFRPPVVLMAYGREFRLTGGNPLKWLLQQYILRQVTFGFAISEWTVQQLVRARIRPDRIRIIHPGIPAGRFSRVRDVARLRERLGVGERKALLTVGRLVERKGHAQVILAVPELIRQVGPLAYLIVGEGPEQARLRELAVQSGANESVIFAGGLDDNDVVDCYHLCDAFVMPTRDIPGDPGEGFGIAYLEANAAGKPVIATNCCGVPDAVADGVSGLLIPADDPAALVEACARVLSDPALARSLGEGGRRRAQEEFTWDTAAAGFVEGLRELQGVR